MLYQNAFIVKILYFFMYIAIINYDIMKFYNIILTPCSRLRHPLRDSFFICLLLLCPMIYLSAKSRMYSGTYFLAMFLVTAITLFKDKLSIRMAAYLFAVLAYEFIELLPASFFLLANCFSKKIDLIPQHPIDEDFVLLSFIYLVITDICFLCFISLLANSFQGHFNHLPISVIASLSTPFFTILATCNTLAGSKDYLALTIRCIVILPMVIFSLFLLRYVLKKMEQQELMTLKRENQKRQIKHRLKYYKNIEKAFNIYRKWKHALSNHLSIISILLEQKGYKEIERYLTSYITKEIHEKNV